MNKHLETEVTEALKSVLKTSKVSGFLQAMPGDASDRKYYRYILNSDVPSDTASSFVIMKFSGSIESPAEEFTPGDRSKFSDRPFVNMLNILQSNDLNIPKLYHVEDGFLILEDLGQTELYHLVSEHGFSDQIISYYKKALDQLILFHGLSRDPENNPCIGFSRQFDQSVYNWEFEHFVEYGLHYLLPTAHSDTKSEQLMSVFRKISELLSNTATCLSHRDFHAKNLMINQEQVYLIDFQDAILAPPEYDLASLLNDSYIECPDDLQERLFGYYQENQQNERLRPSKEMFYLTSLQRNLKAAGRFVYIWEKKKKDSHMPYYWPSIQKIQTYRLHHPLIEEVCQLLPMKSLQSRIAELGYL